MKLSVYPVKEREAKNHTLDRTYKVVLPPSGQITPEGKNTDSIGVLEFE